MKKFLIAFFSLSLAFTASSYAQTEVEITNNAGVAVHSIFSSDTANPDWGPDLLGDDFVLAPGAKVSIIFPAGYSCKVDLKASADPDDQDSISFSGINICEISGIVLQGGGKASAY
jgi:hypothetical protein